MSVVCSGFGKVAFAFIRRAAFGKNARIVRQMRDAQAFGVACRDSAVPQSSPPHDPRDVPQAFVEWLHVTGSLPGIKLGRQQTSCGAQRRR